MLNTKTRYHILAGVAAAGLTLGMSGPANAAGFFVQEISSSGAGASYAGQAAMPRDSSIIFHNPSGLTHLDQRQLNVAIHGLYTDSDVDDLGSTVGDTPFASAGGPLAGFSTFTDDGGNPGGLKTIPNFYFATPVTDDNRLWVGLGATAPFGLGVDYDDNFFGAFTAQKVELKTIDLTPTVAYQVNDVLSLGASAIIQYGDINFQAFLPTTTTDFLRVTGDDYAYGYKLGATLTPTDDLRVGLNYRSRLNLDFDGSQNGTPLTGGNPVDSEGTLNLPDIANFAVAYDLNDRWTVMGGVDWYGWSETDQVTITPTAGSALTVNFAYENTLNFNLGAEYMYSDSWTFRAGYLYDETPTTSEARSFVNPDGDRHWFSAGATYTHSENISIDFGATYLDVEDGNVNQLRDADGAGPSPTVNILGEADNSAFIGSVGVNYKF